MSVNTHSGPSSCRKPDRKHLGVSLIAMLAALLLAAVQSAGQEAPSASKPGASATMISEGLDSAGKISLRLNRSAVLSTVRPYKRVSVAQPEVADVNLIGPQNILLTAKKPGSTQLIVWDEADHSQVVEVSVQVDLEALREQLKAMFPAAQIEVASAAGTVALRGRVPTLETAEQAAAVVGPYGGGKVLNFLEVSGGQQVMLQVRFAEVSRSAAMALGVNFGFTDGRAFGASNIGQVNPFGVNGIGAGAGPTVGSPNPSVSLFGQGQMGSTALSVFVSALQQNNLMRILAEPNLVAISGQQAYFLAGGKFPVPVPQAGGTGAATITIEYREFGVRLRFVPTVMGDGRIRLQVAPEVSDLDFTTAVRFGGFVIPGLTSRELNTTIELAEGQTFAIGGLLSHNVTASNESTPVLGDVPVLGALFRSVRYQRKETELVVLVTPRLVEAMNPAQVPTLPGETWRHPTMNELFLNRDLGGEGGEKGRGPTSRPGKDQAPDRFKGEWGFVAAE